jgi:hypothetical protein
VKDVLTNFCGELKGMIEQTVFFTTFNSALGTIHRLSSETAIRMNGCSVFPIFLTFTSTRIIGYKHYFFNFSLFYNVRYLSNKRDKNENTWRAQDARIIEIMAIIFWAQVL